MMKLYLILDSRNLLWKSKIDYEIKNLCFENVRLNYKPIMHYVFDRSKLRTEKIEISGSPCVHPAFKLLLLLLSRT